MIWAIVIFGTALFGTVCSLDEGQACVKNGVPGTCTMLKNCQSAIDEIRKQKRPQVCSFSGREPVVCCVAAPAPPPSTTSRPPVATTQKRPASTTPYVPQEYVYEDAGDGQCEPLSPKLTAKKTGNKSFDKCIEYQETLVYPCQQGVDLTGQLSRSNKCAHETDELIVGGADASKGEFPHMALVGYGTIEDNLWLCGGTLISDRFVLTAGHCTYYRKMPASLVALGVYKRTSVDLARVYSVAEVIPHPEYKPPHKYNDIALLKTEQAMKLDQFAVPACLPVSAGGAGGAGGGVGGAGGSSDVRALATGWGATEYRGGSADTLQKVILTKFTREECSSKFPVNNRTMPRGFDPQSQICYGDKTKSKDTCQGDSGGPLQLRHKQLHCMYSVVGVTSFGKACGYIGDPGIYTRVQYYTPWIERHLWG